MTGYFPCFRNIDCAPVLVLGGDAHAAAKVKKLLPYGAEITVLAPVLCAELSERKKNGEINTVFRDFDDFEEVLTEKKPTLVLVTDVGTDSGLYARIFAACRARGIEINTEDKQQYCTFIFPSLIQRGALTVAISTAGASPAVAKKLREEIELTLPDATDKILDWLAALRPAVQGSAAIPRENRAALWRALADAAFSQNRTLNNAEVAAILQKYFKEPYPRPNAEALLPTIDT